MLTDSIIKQLVINFNFVERNIVHRHTRQGRSQAWADHVAPTDQKLGLVMAKKNTLPWTCGQTHLNP